MSPARAAARVDDVNWEAVRARIAVGAPELRDSPARLASLRQWLERIVATLPEPRQRMYDLFVTRGLDSRNAALELAATVAEVRRLRRENRQAILRAFEVTALAAAEAAVDPPSIGAPGCGELRQILADARSDDGDPHEDGRRHTAALPAALRLTLSRHLSQCRACQERRDDCMARWAPELLPILADAELHEQVMEDLQSMPELRQPGAGPGAHRRVAPAGPATKVVIGRAAAAAGTRAACGAAAARVRVARGSARNASCHGRVVAGPEQGRHQRRRCPEGDRHRRRGPRRQPRATGPPAGDRPLSSLPPVAAGRLGRILVRVGAAIRVLHRSAFNSANVVPHAADFRAVPVAIFVAVKNDVTDAEPVQVHADTDAIYLHATPTDLPPRRRRPHLPPRRRLPRARRPPRRHPRRARPRPRRRRARLPRSRRPLRRRRPRHRLRRRPRCRRRRQRRRRQPRLPQPRPPQPQT